MTSPKKTQNIGLLVLDLQLDYSVSIAKGMAEITKANNANLVIFPIEQPKVESGSSDEPSVVHDLLKSAPIDALVVVTSSLVNFLSFSQFSRELDKLNDLPILSIGAELRNHPSIVNDNKMGLKQAISHLICNYKLSKIAFVRGPLMHPEAEERYEAYLETLKKHGLNVDMDYVSEGNFTFEAGFEAAAKFIALSNGLPEAIVCANDDMACGVLHVLEERGIKVPEEVAVVGYDNIREAAFTTPPLSSVDQPVLEIGKQSAQLALSMANGEKVKHLTVVPTRFVQRNSCGSGVKERDKQTADSSSELVVVDSIDQTRILELLATSTLNNSQIDEVSNWLSGLKLENDKVDEIGRLFSEFLNDRHTPEEMSQIVSENILLVKKLAAQYDSGGRYLPLYYLLSSIANQYFYAQSVQKGLKIDNRYLQLRNLISLAAKKSSTFDFFRSLHKFLHSIDYHFFYIVLYHNRENEESKGNIEKCSTVFGFNKNNQLSDFNSYDHPPNELFHDEKSSLIGETFNVEPLIYLGHCFGHICYSWDQEDRYTRLSFSSIISAKLRSDKLWNDYLTLENAFSSKGGALNGLGMDSESSSFNSASLLDQKEFYMKAAREFENSKISHNVLPLVFVKLVNHTEITAELGAEYIDIYVNFISDSLVGLFGATSLITRLKPDMFVVLSPKIDMEQINIILEKIKKKIHQYKDEANLAIELKLESAINQIHPDSHRSLVDHIGDADYLLTRMVG